MPSTLVSHSVTHEKTLPTGVSVRTSDNQYTVYTLEGDSMDLDNHWLVEENTLPGGQDVRVYVSFRECFPPPGTDRLVFGRWTSDESQGRCQTERRCEPKADRFW